MPRKGHARYTNSATGIATLPNEALVWIFDILALHEASDNEARLSRVQYLEEVRLPELQQKRLGVKRELQRIQGRDDDDFRFPNRRYGDLTEEFSNLKHQISDAKGERRRLRFSWKKAFNPRTSFARCLVNVCKRWREVIENERPEMNTNVIIFLDAGLQIPVAGLEVRRTPSELRLERTQDAGFYQLERPFLAFGEDTDDLGTWDMAKLKTILSRSARHPVNVCVTYAKRNIVPPPPRQTTKSQSQSKRWSKHTPSSSDSGTAPVLSPELEATRLSQLFATLKPHVRRIKRISVQTQYSTSTSSVLDTFDTRNRFDPIALKKLQVRNPLWRVTWTPDTRKRLDEEGEEVVDQDDVFGADPDDERDPLDTLGEEGTDTGALDDPTQPSQPQTGTMPPPTAATSSSNATQEPKKPVFGALIKNPADAPKYWNAPVFSGYSVIEALMDDEWVKHFCGPMMLNEQEQQHQYYQQQQQKGKNKRGPPPPRPARNITFKKLRIGEGGCLGVHDFLRLLSRNRLGYIRTLEFEDVEVCSAGAQGASAAFSTPMASQGGSRRAVGTQNVQIAVKYLKFRHTSWQATSAGTTTSSTPSFLTSFFTLTNNSVFLASLTLSSIPLSSLPVFTSSSPLQAWVLNIFSLPSGSFPLIIDIVKNWNGLALHISGCGDTVDDRLLELLTRKKASTSWAGFFVPQLRILNVAGSSVPFDADAIVAGLRPGRTFGVGSKDGLGVDSSTDPKVAFTPHALKEMVLARQREYERHDPLQQSDLNYTFPMSSIVVKDTLEPISEEDERWLREHVDMFSWQKPIQLLMEELEKDMAMKMEMETKMKMKMKMEDEDEEAEHVNVKKRPRKRRRKGKKPTGGVDFESEAESANSEQPSTLEFFVDVEPDDIQPDDADLAEPWTVPESMNVVPVIDILDSDEEGGSTSMSLGTTVELSTGRATGGHTMDPIVITDSEDEATDPVPGSDASIPIPVSSPSPSLCPMRSSSPISINSSSDGREEDEDAVMTEDVHTQDLGDETITLAPTLALETQVQGPSEAGEVTPTNESMVAESHAEVVEVTRFIPDFDSPVLDNDLCDDLSMNDIEALDLDYRPSTHLSVQPPILLASTPVKALPVQSPPESAPRRSPPHFETPPLLEDYSDIFRSEDLPDF